MSLCPFFVLLAYAESRQMAAGDNTTNIMFLPFKEDITVIFK